MNISAMSGAASATDRLMVRTGSRHSPVWMATYSKPPKAPKPILPSRLKVMMEKTGISIRSGWYSARVPRARKIQGSTTTAAKVRTISMPPALWIHLPTPRPTVVESIRAPTRRKLMAAMNPRFPVSVSAPGPKM